MKSLTTLFKPAPLIQEEDCIPTWFFLVVVPVPRDSRRDWRRVFKTESISDWINIDNIQVLSLTLSMSKSQKILSLNTLSGMVLVSWLNSLSLNTTPEKIIWNMVPLLPDITP